MSSAVLFLRAQDELLRYLYAASGGGVLALLALGGAVLLVGAGVVVLARRFGWTPLPTRSGGGRGVPAPPRAGFRSSRTSTSVRIGS